MDEEFQRRRASPAVDAAFHFTHGGRSADSGIQMMIANLKRSAIRFSITPSGALDGCAESHQQAALKTHPRQEIHVQI
jgi:hypothetical protein